MQSATRGRIVRPALTLAAGLMTGFFAAGSSGRAAALRPGLAEPQAATVDLETQTVQFQSGRARVSAYLARPKTGGKHAAVIVVHDTGGLNDQVRSVARRFAEAGLVALAPDLIRGAKATAQLPIAQPVNDLRAALAFLRQDASVDGERISSVGFGWGGWRAFRLAQGAPMLYRAVVFYGSTPTEDTFADTHASVLAHYAQYDFRTTGNAEWTQKELGKKFSYYVYPKTERGFFFASSPENAEAATLAWTRTVEFLK
jgi:carboxymethylenebutenolidase